MDPRAHLIPFIYIYIYIYIYIVRMLPGIVFSKKHLKKNTRTHLERHPRASNFFSNRSYLERTNPTTLAKKWMEVARFATLGSIWIRFGMFNGGSSWTCRLVGEAGCLKIPLKDISDTRGSIGYRSKIVDAKSSSNPHVYWLAPNCCWCTKIVILWNMFESTFLVVNAPLWLYPLVI